MVEKEVERVENKGLKLPIKSVGLSSAEKEVKHLIDDEFLTVKQIAQRRSTTVQAVYKILKKVNNKTGFKQHLNRVEKVESTHSKSDIRLHGQEFNIRILWQDNKYQELLEKSNIVFWDGNSVRLYKNSIEIYSGQSFFGKDEQMATSSSLEYWKRFIGRLEHDLKTILIKPRSRNIRVVNHHYARGNSEIAENAINEKERIWIYAEEDGKLAFITDNSFGFKEDETVHPITAQPDRKAIDKQVNDWRLRDPPTNSELANNIKEVIEGQKLITINQDYYGKHLVSHVSAVQGIDNGIKEIGIEQKRFNDMIEKNNEIMEKIAKLLESKGI